MNIIPARGRKPMEQYINTQENLENEHNPRKGTETGRSKTCS